MAIRSFSARGKLSKAECLLPLLEESEFMFIEYQYLGPISYEEALELMQAKIEDAVQQKKGYFFGLEHSPRIYTSGLTLDKKDILTPNLKVVKARRGGSVTVHGPGQLVFYTVIPVDLIFVGLEGFIRILEGAIIFSLEEVGIHSFCYAPHSGVFTNDGKIGFVGLGLKSRCIYHGISINLNNSIEEFLPINSCGLTLPIAFGTKLTQKTIELRPFAERLHHFILDSFADIDGTAFREKYEKVNNETCFKHGIVYFNQRRFWHSHEVWEILWHRVEPGPYHTFLQALIQLSMGLYKLMIKVNLKGARSLFTKALAKIKESNLEDKYFYRLTEQKTIKEFIENMLTTFENDGSINDENARKKVFSPYILMAIDDYESFNQNLYGRSPRL